MVEMTLEQILQTGLSMERKARAFYLGALEVVTHAGAREMLRELAAEEERHVDLFARALAGEAVVFGEGAPTARQELHIGEHLVAAEIGNDSDPGTILVRAIRKEMAAVDQYNAWLEQVKDDSVKALLEGLVAEELVHKDRLERMYDEEFLTDN